MATSLSHPHQNGFLFGRRGSKHGLTLTPHH